MKIFAFVEEISPGKWKIIPNKKKKAQTNTTSTFSSKMRELRKNNPNLVIPFLKAFKNAFEQGVNDEIENLEQSSLLQAIYEIKLQNSKNSF